MLLEHVGGESLARLNLAGRLSLPDSGSPVIQITKLQAGAYEQHLIHKGINSIVYGGS